MVLKKTTTKAKPAKKPLRTKKAPAKKPAGASKPNAKTVRASNSPPSMTSEERAQRIAVAAYLRAETRGFARGGEVSDWLFAEQEVDTSSAST